MPYDATFEGRCHSLGAIPTSFLMVPTVKAAITSFETISSEVFLPIKVIVTEAVPTRFPTLTLTLEELCPG